MEAGADERWTICACEEDGALATKGVGGTCPIHGGDACLRMVGVVRSSRLAEVEAERDTALTGEAFERHERRVAEAERDRLHEAWEDQTRFAGLVERKLDGLVADRDRLREVLKRIAYGSTDEFARNRAGAALNPPKP